MPRKKKTQKDLLEWWLGPNMIRRELESVLGKPASWWHENFFRAGSVMGMDGFDVDMDELSLGIKHELEHTKSPALAMKIAMDHLSEYRDYYTQLEKLEKRMKKRKGQ